MTLHIKFLLVFAALAFQLRSQNIFDLNNSLKFANHLKQIGDYEHSLEEFKRVNFFDKDNYEIQSQILSLNIKLGLFHESLDLISKSKFEKKFHQEKFYSLIKLKKIQSLKEDLKKNKDEISLNDYHFFNITSSLLNDDFEIASNYISNLNKLDKNEYIDQYSTIIKKSKNIRHKSPVVAAVLSTFVPGSGKFYTHNYKDGIITFITVAASGFQSYKSFSKTGNQSVSGWLYAGFSLFIYSGNIYGSYVSANKVNTNNYNRINDQIHLNIDNYYKN